MIPLTPAEDLLQSLGVREPKDIDLEAIAFDQGATVIYRSLYGCEARIVGSGNRSIITIEKNGIPARRRFSLAHELGHWHHHRGRSFSCRSEEIGNLTRSMNDPERVADGYAADLLLPRFIFLPRAAALKRNSFESVEDLRAEFGTSITATALRLAQQGPERSMLICHSKARRRWFHRPRYIPNRWFPRDELDTRSVSFELLYGSGTRSNRRRISADVWFDRRDAWEFEVEEQSQKISEDEILTFLTFRDQRMLVEQ